VTLIDTSRLSNLFEQGKSLFSFDPVGLPQDRDAANKLAARRQELMYQRAEAELAFAETVAPLMEAYDTHKAVLDSQIADIETGLVAFHAAAVVEARLNGEPEPLTIKLDNAELKSNMGQSKWSYLDDKAFTRWVLGKIPSAKKPDPEPQINKNVAKNVLADCAPDDDGVITFRGEPVPGVKVTPPVREYRVV
jgi:hypothetical protein